MIDDGGCGHGSDEEGSTDSGDGGGGRFLVGDDYDSESNGDDAFRERIRGSGTNEGDVVDLANQNPEGGGIPQRAFPIPRIARIDSDEEEEEEEEGGKSSKDGSDKVCEGQTLQNLEGHGVAPSSIAQTRRARELARLSAWGWDSRIEDHPPNQNVYGPAEGKRERKLRMSATQLEEALGTEPQRSQEVCIDSDKGQALDEDTGAPLEITGKDDRQLENPLEDILYSSDDDTPLVRLPRLPNPHPSSLQQTQLVPVPPTLNPPLATSAQQIAASTLAQALLGSLYVSPPVSLPELHRPAPAPVGDPQPEEVQEEVIPDSQEGDDW